MAKMCEVPAPKPIKTRTLLHLHGSSPASRWRPGSRPCYNQCGCSMDQHQAVAASIKGGSDTWLHVEGALAHQTPHVQQHALLLPCRGRRPARLTCLTQPSPGTCAASCSRLQQWATVGAPCTLPHNMLSTASRYKSRGDEAGLA